MQFGRCMTAGLFSMMLGTLSAQTAPPAKATDADSAQVAAWAGEVQGDLIAGKVDELDRMADGYRREKARFPGGGWKINRFYAVLATPEGPDLSTQDHLNRLDKWVKLRPESLTARVALAESLLRWAWIARGSATSKETSKEAFALFFERLGKAKEVLDGASSLKVMGPEWFWAELQLGLAQQWPLVQERDMFDRAVQFEPAYAASYAEMAKYLLPKWYGEKGDATRFAAESADKIGGESGDLLYFQIIASLLTRENEGSMGKEVDFSRLTRGYTALTREYGATRLNLNQYAYMAGRCEDVETLRAQLRLIGDDWYPSVWLSRSYFDRVRDWARDQSQ